jgi:alkylated DNA repair dioxygenase AlkB
MPPVSKKQRLEGEEEHITVQDRGAAREGEEACAIAHKDTSAREEQVKEPDGRAEPSSVPGSPTRKDPALRIQRRVIYSSGGAEVYHAQFGCFFDSNEGKTRLLDLFRRVEAALLGVKKVASIKEAAKLAPAPAWFRRTSRWGGTTNRLIMTLKPLGALGSSGHGYRFSAQVTPAVAWEHVEGFQELAAILTSLWGQEFNMCHANYYTESGGKMASLGRHADDERDLVEDQNIVCVSLGNWPMSLRLYEKEGGKRVADEPLLPHTVYVMAGKTQKLLEHEIVQATRRQIQATLQSSGRKQRPAASPARFRISLTFRLTKK